jgi:hypothetical protein
MMKRSLMMLLFVLLMSPLTYTYADSADQDIDEGDLFESVVTLRRTVYVANCQHSVPLHSYGNCSEYSRIGELVGECAMDQAIDDCQADFNVDCSEVSIRVIERSSAEFPGYKVCKAKARVHGYGL